MSTNSASAMRSSSGPNPWRSGSNQIAALRKTSRESMVNRLQNVQARRQRSRGLMLASSSKQAEELMPIRSAPASQRPFRNREEAGRVLADRLKQYARRGAGAAPPRAGPHRRRRSGGGTRNL